MIIEKISHSAFKIFQECPRKYYLYYIKKVRPNDNSIYLTFGSACHETLERLLDGKITREQVKDFYHKQFDDLMEKELTSEYLNKILNDKTLFDMTQDMRASGPALVLEAVDALDREFPGYELLFTEKEIDDVVSFPNLSRPVKFKGFIDLIIKHEGKFYIIDWKTASWGWNKWKRGDKIKQYQLSLYKHFFCKEYNVPLEQVETKFTLLKRTAKKNRIEFIKVGNGPKRIDNCLKLLQKTLFLIENNVKSPNLRNCKFCPFAGTEYCPESVFPD